MRSQVAFVVAFSAALSVFAAPATLPCDAGLFANPATTKCASTCPSTYFGDATTRTCKRCYNHTVLQCTSAKSTAATKCQTRYYLNSGRCVPTAKVAAGFYGDATTGRITKCPTGAATCSTPSGAVLTCTPGLFFSAVTNTCVASCPAGYAADSSTWTCKLRTCFSYVIATCSGPAETDALTCQYPYGLERTSGLGTGRCIIAPDGYFLSGAGTLQPCGNGEKTCTALAPSSCLPGYILNYNGNQCDLIQEQHCDAHAVCQDFTSTIVGCRPGYFLTAGNEDKACVSTCSSSQGLLSYWRGACIAGPACPLDSYLSPNGRDCLSCDPQGLQSACSGTTPVFCGSDQYYHSPSKRCLIKCRDDQYMSSDGCVSISTCRTGYYITGLADPDPDACVPCPQQGACENYTGRMTTCTQPGVEFLLVEAGLCFNGCPAARTPWDCQPKIDDPTDFRCLPSYFAPDASSVYRCLPCGGAASGDPFNPAAADIYASTCKQYGGDAPTADSCIDGYHVDTTLGSDTEGFCITN